MRRLARSFAKMHTDIVNNMDLGKTEPCERTRLIFQKAGDAFLNPTDGQHISELGDLTSFYALHRARDKMRQESLMLTSERTQSEDAS